MEMSSRHKEREVAARVERAQGFALSRKLIVLANILKRSAGARYRRLLGLPGVDWGVIAILGECAPRTLNDLADAMGLDKTQISRSVSNLVERGYVNRSVNPRNQREVLITLSSTGKAAETTIRKAAMAANQTLLDGMTPSERKKLEQQLNLLTSRAEKMLGAQQEFDAATRSEESGLSADR
jgi:DNA-binding MarR family transcriptional regulator